MFELLTDDATLPVRATKGSVGYDLVATSYEWNESKTKIEYTTGVALKGVPEGFFAAVFPRSSISETDLRLANSVGVIDPDFKDGIRLVFDVPLSAAMVVSPGNCRIYGVNDRIAQIVFLPFLVDDVVVPTEEREGGFGSTGKKKK